MIPIDELKKMIEAEVPIYSARKNEVGQMEVCQMIINKCHPDKYWRGILISRAHVDCRIKGENVRARRLMAHLFKSEKEVCKYWSKYKFKKKSNKIGAQI